MGPIQTALVGMQAGPAKGASEAQLRQAAKELEITFVADMLKSAGFGESRKAFGGGAGEAQFASFLRTENAKAMVDAGGLGLAESLFHALKERVDDAL